MSRLISIYAGRICNTVDFCLEDLHFGKVPNLNSYFSVSMVYLKKEKKKNNNFNCALHSCFLLSLIQFDKIS